MARPTLVTTVHFCKVLGYLRKYKAYYEKVSKAVKIVVCKFTHHSAAEMLGVPVAGLQSLACCRRWCATLARRGALELGLSRSLAPLLPDSAQPQVVLVNIE